MGVIIADGILVMHFLFIAFVLLGQAGIVIGGVRHWAWVRQRGFRLVHLAAITFIVLQSWAGMLCPLTAWENSFRRAEGETAYTGTFVSHWIGKLVYHDFPQWLFMIVYTLFGLVALASWFVVKPEMRKRGV